VSKWLFPDRLPVSQSFESTLLWKGGHIFPWPMIKLNCVMGKNNYYFFIYNGLPPNNSHFQKVFTNILTQKHGVIQNKRYICNLIS